MEPDNQVGLSAAEKFEINFARLSEALLTQQWHGHCEIVQNWQFPYGDDRSLLTVVRYKRKFKAEDGHIREATSYLRWSKGPVQGYHWDIYPDDFRHREWALVALSRAPAPPRDWRPDADCRG
jgi:hypothetical protein